MKGDQDGAGMAPGAQDTAWPLCVDLDGTLLRTDMLFETLTGLLRTKPWRAVLIPVWLMRGRAYLKARLAAEVPVDPALLPYRADLAAFVRSERAKGRRTVLVSASNGDLVSAIAAHLKMFDEAIGSSETRNLKGAAKAEALAARYPDGFCYAGNEMADVAVWRQARSIVIAGAGAGVTRAAQALNKPVEASFPDKQSTLRLLIKEARVHQWSKNVLVFLPLLLAHHFHDVHAWTMTALAFAALCLTASATYIVNDLLDLPSDRQHPTKCRRPLASGRLGIAAALAAMTALFAAGFALALAAGWLTVLAIVCYVVLTLTYSYWFKKLAMFDVAALGILFTSRLGIGCVAAALEISPWLLAFSFALFFSLSTAKRHTEIVKKARADAQASIPGRGYDVDDDALTLAYGVASSVASVVILMLYTTNGVAQELYRSPKWLWAFPLLLHLWQTRIWLYAHRGVLDDDPIVFALKDKVSLLIGVGCAAAFYLAL